VIQRAGSGALATWGAFPCDSWRERSLSVTVAVCKCMMKEVVDEQECK
jgi:hypothetical protein